MMVINLGFYFSKVRLHFILSYNKLQLVSLAMDAWEKLKIG